MKSDEQVKHLVNFGDDLVIATRLIFYLKGFV